MASDQPNADTAAVPALYGSEKTGTEYVSKAHSIEKLMTFTPEGESWDGLSGTEKLPENEELKNLLYSILPPDQISFSDKDRILNSYGKSSIEILNARLGRMKDPVDAVVFPDYKSVETLIRQLDRNKYQLIPVGGSSCVTGALVSSSKKIRIALNTRNFRRADFREDYILLGSGYTGKEAESILNEHGYTIGNFPESFEYSTIGGWVATKAVGQESNQYGGIENIVIGIGMIGSDGYFREEFVPRNSESFDLKSLALGMEGKTGLITDVAFKMHRKPVKRFMGSYFFRTYEEGIRNLSNMKFYSSIMRLSDEVETFITLDGEFDTPLKKLYEKYLKLMGVRNGSILIVSNNDSEIPEIPKKATNAGKYPAKKWYERRYSRPELGNILWKHGLIPDTLETSTTWNNLYRIHVAVKQRFSDETLKENARGIIMSHISHMYSTGACIYFTFVLWRKDGQMELLEHMRDAIMDEFMKNGCAVTHHHGPGKYLEKYLDEKLLARGRMLQDPLFSEE